VVSGADTNQRARSRALVPDAECVTLISEPIIVCAPHLTSQGLLIWNTKYGTIRCGYKNTNYSLPSIYNHLSLRSSFMVFRFVNNRKPEPLKDADGDTDADAPNLVWYFRTFVLRRLLRSRGSREVSRSSLSQMTHFSDLLSSTPRNPNTICSHALEPQHVAAPRCHQVHIVMNATPAHSSFWKFHNTNRTCS
jgi:hypothetical protein